jgi:hypothetical protein
MNRKQRRGAATDSTSAQLGSAADIPLARPNTTRGKGKTLLEIAAERKTQLGPRGQPFPKANKNLTSESEFVKISPDGRLTTDPSQQSTQSPDDADTTGPVPPILDTIFLALPLSCLHFTLSFLTAHQYAQELRVRPLILNTIFVAFPTLTLVIHLLHGHLFGLNSARIPRVVHKAAAVAQQIVFLLAANVAGCYLIHLTNDKGYYAVMKKAPSIGTVWVWSIIELGLAGALAGVAGPGLFAWWNGYGIW